MAQWYTFTHADTFSPELLVGMYDRWLKVLPYGPTQAERMLVHTPMLDLAHERRFVFSQMGSRLDSFEADHCRRLQYALDSLNRFYDQHGGDGHESRTTQDHVSLADLTSRHRDAGEYESSLALDIKQHNEVATAEPEADVVLSSEQVDAAPIVEHSTPRNRLDDSISVDEDEETDVIETWIRNARQKCRAHSAQGSERPRQLAHLKVRKSTKKTSSISKK